MEAPIQRLDLNDTLSQRGVSDLTMFVLYRVEFTHKLLCSSESLYRFCLVKKCFNLVLFVVFFKEIESGKKIPKGRKTLLLLAYSIFLGQV